MSCPPNRSQLQAIAASIQKAKSILNKASNFSAGTVIKGLGARLVSSFKSMFRAPSVTERKDHSQVIEDAASRLTDIETEMYPGGTEIQSYINDLHITVGGAYVSSKTSPPIRKVMGMPVIKKIKINNQRTDVEMGQAPYVETLSHPVPFGNYSIVANNSFNLVVGANGIAMSTDGNFDVNAFGVSTISSLHGLNLTTSEGNLNIICGNHVQIVGQTVNIQTCNENDQVVINSNLGVKNNAVIHGSLYVDGEIYGQHLTVPAQTQETTQTKTRGTLPPEAVIAYADFAPWCAWFDSVFLPALLIDLELAWLGTYSGAPFPFNVVSRGWTNTTFRAFMPGLKFACRSFGHIGSPSIPNGMYCYNPGAPVGSHIDLIDPIHYGNHSDKMVDITPHTHQYYGVASSKKPGNGDIRDAASVINDGNVGIAGGIIHGGSGLHV